MLIHLCSMQLFDICQRSYLNGSMLNKEIIIINDNTVPELPITLVFKMENYEHRNITEYSKTYILVY